MKRKRIRVPEGVATKIQREMPTTYPTIRSALLGITETELADKIRAKALELGGVEVKR